MKILITGGLGFIGSRLATSLLHRGHDVVLVDSLSPQIHGEVPETRVPESATVVRLDVRELAQRHDLLEGSDVVFHLAAETGTAQSMYQIAHYVSVNELGTAALLEAIAKCTRRPRQVVLASSRSIYGEGAYRAAGGDGHIVQPSPRTRQQLASHHWEHTTPQGDRLEAVPTPESLLPAPGSVYAATKASQEMLIASASEALGIKSQILRFQNVYGEGQSLQNPYTGIISIFFNRARQGLEIPVYEDGLESRDFVHVDDVVRALDRVLAVDLPSGTVINVGSGLATTVLTLSRTLLKVAGLDVPVRVTGQYRLGDIRHGFADITRLNTLLGLEPEISLEEGLRRFSAWASKQPAHVDRLDAATQELQKKGLSNT